jgi:5-hydroxyisourate hydrolase-like protein (transthyretin family)
MRGCYLWLMTALIAMLVAGCSSAPGKLQGHVLYQDGSPAAGVKVTVYTLQEQAQAPGVYIEGEVVAESTTDEQGSYQISDLPPGKYVVKSTDGEHAAQRMVQIQSGRTSQADLTLSQ